MNVCISLDMVFGNGIGIAILVDNADIGVVVVLLTNQQSPVQGAHNKNTNEMGLM